MKEDKEKFEEIKQHYEFITKGLEEKTKFIDISILEHLGKLIQITENLIARNKELEKQNKTLKSFTSSIFNDSFEKDYIPVSKVKEKIEELDRRIDYLDKELAEAYIVREKLGTETDIDTNEQYIYNMEQERSIRHTQKRILQELLED